ncbi:hypothetical protein COL5a_010048 [Colletotrichum fioriniae]|uniref:uncharacterized protein n=1 Tax=Colletotrichum fioriniae TaxID=710243 RepID=UPI0023007E1C|nr:uncharacterized protein COL516b_007262 [Colletotrichum fioriniae]KAJ0302211.1 hypothetical protein COL516b_007262 [Colletotrichum fioriniae]KAJ0319871.1 hypothetical protein COL5a_010048 [Colletotrichum fioriniae]KAJ3950435.1 hypothetical protein N0V96_001580 [Colletotrichum fioriniae]
MPNQMTKDGASRIQASQDKGGRDMSSGGFAARAQGAGDRNANAGVGGQGQGGAGAGAGQGGQQQTGKK